MTIHEVPFTTAKTLNEVGVEDFDCIVENFLARSQITSLSAKVKVGKTTFTGAMLKAIFEEQEFLAHATQYTKVVYCTEEGQNTFLRFLKRVGLELRDDLTIVHLHDVRSLTWDDRVESIGEIADKTNSELIIWDTLTRWARIKDENSSGEAAIAMEPIEELRRKGFTQLLSYHGNKSGGQGADGQRGSTAYSGAADTTVFLRDPGLQGHPNRREVYQTGRTFDNFEWHIDWNKQDRLYDLVGEATEDGSPISTERDKVALSIIHKLAEASDWMTKQDIGTSLSADYESGTFVRALKFLEANGGIVVKGRGVRGDPKYYAKAGQAFLPKIGAY